MKPPAMPEDPGEMTWLPEDFEVAEAEMQERLLIELNVLVAEALRIQKWCLPEMLAEKLGRIQTVADLLGTTKGGRNGSGSTD